MRVRAWGVGTGIRAWSLGLQPDPYPKIGLRP